MGHIYAHITCTRVRWEEGVEEPIDEHGWIDRSWSPYVLRDSRNDVRPVVDVDEDYREELREEVLEALIWLGEYENCGDGTFYAKDSYSPIFDNPEGWRYGYALHFTCKFYGPGGWTEKDWNPRLDGGLSL